MKREVNFPIVTTSYGLVDLTRINVGHADCVVGLKIEVDAMKVKLGFVLLAIMLLAGAARAEQLVRAGYPPFAAPLSSLPGATQDNYRRLDPTGTLAEGALIDLMNAIAKDARLQVQFVMVPSTEQIAALNSKKIDLGLMLSQIGSGIDADFTEPLYQDSEALVVKKTDKKQYTSWEDLRGEVIAACGPVASAAQRSGIFKEVMIVPICGEVPQAVRDPEIKAGIKGSFIDTLYAQQHGVYEPDVQMSMSYQPKFVAPRRFATRKDDALLSTVNASLAKLRNDGTLKMIFTKYGIDGTLVK
jgi:polar amino acid transport system substrate-binding protein